MAFVACPGRLVLFMSSPQIEGTRTVGREAQTDPSRAPIISIAMAAKPLTFELRAFQIAVFAHGGSGILVAVGVAMGAVDSRMLMLGQIALGTGDAENGGEGDE